MASLAVVNAADKIDLSGSLNTGVVGGLVLMAVMIFCVAKSSESDGK